MHSENDIKKFKYYEKNNFQFLKLPFNSDDDDTNKYYMLIALPISDDFYVLGDLFKYEKIKNNDNDPKLTYTLFNDAVNMLSNNNTDIYNKFLKDRFPLIDDYEHKVDLFLPKMTIAGPTMNLKVMLMKLGMIEPFDPTLANFHKIRDQSAIDTGNIYISEVLHKTFFEMKEKGVEAAAATVIVLQTESSEDFFETNIMIPFRMDHPFYVSIMAESINSEEQKMLFLGKVNNV